MAAHYHLVKNKSWYTFCGFDVLSSFEALPEKRHFCSRPCNAGAK